MICIEGLDASFLLPKALKPHASIQMLKVKHRQKGTGALVPKILHIDMLGGDRTTGQGEGGHWHKGPATLWQG